VHLYSLKELKLLSSLLLNYSFLAKRKLQDSAYFLKISNKIPYKKGIIFFKEIRNKNRKIWRSRKTLENFFEELFWSCLKFINEIWIQTKNFCFFLKFEELEKLRLTGVCRQLMMSMLNLLKHVDSADLKFKTLQWLKYQKKKLSLNTAKTLKGVHLQ